MRKIGWFDIKTKFKKIVRSIFYGPLGQELICQLLATYIKLVYFTSRKVFINNELVMQRFKNKESLILSSWHNRLMMTPFVATHIKQVNSIDKIFALASKHGDGQFVGKIMEKFGVVVIAGSSKSGRKSTRGIDMHGLKEIFRSLKNNLGIAITPDGPRGPVNKINGEIIKIAKLSSTPIVPMAWGYSCFFELGTWDKFKVPLPFSTICLCFGDLFWVDKNVEEKDILGLNALLEEKMNLIASSADKNATTN